MEHIKKFEEIDYNNFDWEESQPINSEIICNEYFTKFLIDNNIYYKFISDSEYNSLNKINNFIQKCIHLNPHQKENCIKHIIQVLITKKYYNPWITKDNELVDWRKYDHLWERLCKEHIEYTLVDLN